MTIERSGLRPAEADIARNVADLLNRAHGQDLTPDEATAVAVDANRPVRPQAEASDDPATTPEPDDEPDEPGDKRFGDCVPIGLQHLLTRLFVKVGPGQQG